MREKSKEFAFPLMIRESHIDTLGHMNNATYLEIFEDARWDLITKNGYSLAEVHRLKKSPIILEINIKFLKEVKNRDNVIIKTQCIEYEGKIGKLRQALVNSAGEEACVAQFTFGFFDMVTRKLILPTPEWLKAIGVN